MTMLTINETYYRHKQEYPDSHLSLHLIRNAVNSGELKTISAGNKRLINWDIFNSWLGYENAHVATNQDEWQDRNSGYLDRHQKAAQHVSDLEVLKRARQTKSHALSSFIHNLETSRERLFDFDDRLWMTAIDRVKVLADGKLIFCFKDGTEIVN